MSIWPVLRNLFRWKKKKKRKEKIIPNNPAKCVLLKVWATCSALLPMFLKIIVSVCCKCEKSRRKSYFCIGNIQFIPFIFEAEIRLLLTSSRPCFSMFVFKVWKCIDTASRRWRHFIYSWYLLDIVFSFPGDRIINLLAESAIYTKVGHWHLIARHFAASERSMLKGMHDNKEHTVTTLR